MKLLAKDVASELCVKGMVKGSFERLDPRFKNSVLKAMTLIVKEELFYLDAKMEYPLIRIQIIDGMDLHSWALDVDVSTRAGCMSSSFFVSHTIVFPNVISSSSEHFKTIAEVKQYFDHEFTRF